MTLFPYFAHPSFHFQLLTTKKNERNYATARVHDIDSGAGEKVIRQSIQLGNALSMKNDGETK